MLCSKGLIDLKGLCEQAFTKIKHCCVTTQGLMLHTWLCNEDPAEAEHFAKLGCEVGRDTEHFAKLGICGKREKLFYY
jgi:hypothetical protein